MSARRLIINADDLGLVESVNRGIVESIESGIVTSTSLMVNMPGTDDAIDRLRAMRDRGSTASVGLHLNVVAGAPLSTARTLTRSGGFLTLTELAWRAMSRRVDPHDVETELEEQLRRATDALEPLGWRLTHIDSHRHAHCLPGLFEVVLRVAKRHGIGHVRHPYESRHTLLGRPHAVLASGVLRAALTRRTPPDDVRFAGIALMASPTFDRDMVQLLSALPPGTTELMVHPGYDSAELAAIDPYRAPRERELRSLTSPMLRHRVQQAGVELTRFGAIQVIGAA